MMFIDTEKKKLESFIDVVKDFLLKTRKMTFNDKKTKLTKLTEGITFLGYKIKQIIHPVDTTCILFPKKRNGNLFIQLNMLKKLTFVSPSSCMNL